MKSGVRSGVGQVWHVYTLQVTSHLPHLPHTHTCAASGDLICVVSVICAAFASLSNFIYPLVRAMCCPHAAGYFTPPTPFKPPHLRCLRRPHLRRLRHLRHLRLPLQLYQLPSQRHEAIQAGNSAGSSSSRFCGHSSHAPGGRGCGKCGGGGVGGAALGVLLEVWGCVHTQVLLQRLAQRLV